MISKNLSPESRDVKFKWPRHGWRFGGRHSTSCHPRLWPVAAVVSAGPCGSACMNDLPSGPSAKDKRSPRTRVAKPYRHRRFAWIGTAASVLLFAASLVVLWHIVSDVDLAE